MPHVEAPNIPNWFQICTRWNSHKPNQILSAGSFPVSGPSNSHKVYGAARLNLIQWVFPSFLTSNSDSKLTWILAAGSTSEVSAIADIKSPRAICFQGMTCRHQAIAQIASLVQMQALMCYATAVRSTSSSRSPPASMGRGRIGHAPRHRTGFLPHHQSPLNYGQTNPVGTRKMWGSLVEVLGQVACLLTYEPQQIG